MLRTAAMVFRRWSEWHTAPQRKALDRWHVEVGAHAPTWTGAGFLFGSLLHAEVYRPFGRELLSPGYVCMRCCWAGFSYLPA